MGGRNSMTGHGWPPVQVGAGPRACPEKRRAKRGMGGRNVMGGHGGPPVQVGAGPRACPEKRRAKRGMGGRNVMGGHGGPPVQVGAGPRACPEKRRANRGMGGQGGHPDTRAAKGFVSLWLSHPQLLRSLHASYPTFRHSQHRHHCPR
jgi:hypothetical protein